VAHDFNNMLTAIFGNLQFAEQAKSLEEVRPFLEAARLAAERSAALTAQLLAFARRQVIEPKVLDPNELVQRLDTVFRRVIGEQIRVMLSLAAHGRVRADQSQLEQVVMNLVTNARDAMPSGGVLTIEIRLVVRQRHGGRHRQGCVAPRFRTLLHDPRRWHGTRPRHLLRNRQAERRTPGGLQ
jgi:signal transduction histidine kinase